VKLYAFWAYDAFPGCLGGEVNNFHEGGKVSIVSYGPGFLFTPLKILPHKEGLKLQAKLNEIKNNHAKDLDALGKKYRELVAKAAPWLD
jgi:hypothetical protein